MNFILLAIAMLSADPTADATSEATTTPAATPAAAPAWLPDHDISKRHMALWAGGQNTLNVGNLVIGNVNPNYGSDGSVSLTPYQTTAWFVGMRYWLKSYESFDVGIDAGIAVTGVSARVQETKSSRSAPAQVSDVTPPVPSTVFAHLGVPMSVYNGHHYALIVVPQLDVGYGYATVTRAAGELTNSPPAGVKAVVSGAFVQVGVRAGPEISFGYFDIPELVIHPSVGLLVNYQSFSSSLTQAGYEVSQESAADVLGTSVVGSNLAGGIDVLYYF